MEVKINKEIRNYTESIFFGLSLRQFLFSCSACAVALLLYFILKPYFGIETLSWVCILGAVPFAVLGFVTYNGMTAEKFIYAWMKSEFLIPKKLVFNATNIYELMLENIEKDRLIQNKKDKKYKKNSKNNQINNYDKKLQISNKKNSNKKIKNKVKKENLIIDENFEQDI